jgi:alpha-L-fucosidase
MKTRLRLVLTTTLLLTVSGVFAQTEIPADGQPISPDDPRWDWWREARFGLFVHWGPVSLRGSEIGWSRAGERRDMPGTKGGVPVDEYDNLYRRFNPEKFNAREWVAIAKAAGMKYIVLTAKHHDGFCMFDTKTTDYNITRSPFKRDICAELAKACHENGIRLGFYFSPPDWHDTDFFTADHDRYVKRMHTQVRELLTNYGRVSVLWFDSTHGQRNAENNAATWDNAALFPMIRKLQPDILLTKRAGGWGDFNTPEQRVGGFDNKSPWETCMTLCNQWSWKPNDEMKPLKQCLQNLIFSVGGDGNFLFNVGPMPSGEIEPRQVERLKEMGTWLAKYGESIYGTRGGPYKSGTWGASTFKGNIVYLHIFKWNDEQVVLPPLGKKIIHSTVLTGGEISVVQTPETLTVHSPLAVQQEIDTVIKLELDGNAKDILPISVHVPIAGLKASASNVYQNDANYEAEKAFDDDPQTRWATDEKTKQAWLTVVFDKPRTFTQIGINEAYPRIQSFELQTKDANNEWKTFYQGTTIGTNFKTPPLASPLTAKEIRLNILDASDSPTISELKIVK